MNRFRSSVTVALAIVCGTVAALGLAGLGAGDRALNVAKAMESFEWVRNDRCLEKINAAPEPGQTFRFAVFGDIQSGTAQLPRLLAGLHEAVDGEPGISFIIQTGDAASHADPGHYNVLLSALAGSGFDLPLFVVPGNHDVLDGDDSLFRRYFGATPLWFNYGGALFILLDNSSGPFTDEQYDWLEGVMDEQATADSPTFMFMHRQPIHWEGDGNRPVEPLYERLFQILKKHEVDYVFTGHWHGYHREVMGQTVFVVNGRGGDFGHDNRLVSSYLTTVEVGEGAVKDTQVELPPRAGLVIVSLVNDWLIAHLGEFAIRNRLITLLMILSAAAGCVYFIALASKTGSRPGADSEAP